jgi:hypothetical protein
MSADSPSWVIIPPTDAKLPTSNLSQSPEIVEDYDLVLRLEELRSFESREKDNEREAKNKEDALVAIQAAIKTHIAKRDLDAHVGEVK